MRVAPVALLLAMLCLITPSHATTGIASWYEMGHTTANGERYRPDGLTAAHRTLPFGTRVRVTHKGRSVVVRINDRGPFIKGRMIDLSRGAARSLGIRGVARVHMEIVRGAK